MRDILTNLYASMAIRLQRAPEIAAMFKGFAMPLRAWGARRQGDFKDLQVGLDSKPWYVAARRMNPVPLSVPNNVPSGGI